MIAVEKAKLLFLYLPQPRLNADQQFLFLGSVSCLAAAMSRYAVRILSFSCPFQRQNHHHRQMDLTMRQRMNLKAASFLSQKPERTTHLHHGEAESDQSRSVRVRLAVPMKD
jgi:hypothetical protein